jgi:hypothetical protein
MTLRHRHCGRGGLIETAEVLEGRLMAKRGIKRRQRLRYNEAEKTLYVKRHKRERKKQVERG